MERRRNKEERHKETDRDKTFTERQQGKEADRKNRDR
jgi:hypothetical protein